MYQPDDEDKKVVAVQVPYALRMFGFVFLACLSGTLIALTFKLIRWIIGF